MNHSPLPWRIKSEGIADYKTGCYEILCGEGFSDEVNDCLALTYDGIPEGSEGAKANAEYIVLACNAYPNLKTAIQRAITLIDNHEGVQGYKVLTEAIKALEQK